MFLSNNLNLYKMKFTQILAALSLLIISLLLSCEEDEYSIPVLPSGLQNDCIKRSIGPNVTGLDIEFAYAMAIKPEEGRITSASVEASIPGAMGTYLENKSYHTDGSGMDVGIEIGDSSSTSGNTTTVTFTKDTSAATLRYFYIIPEEARGQNVSFAFTATASNNEKISYEMGPYEISNIDYKLDLVVRDSAACYISIQDMQVYDLESALQNPEKIDLIYLFRPVDTISFNHAIVSPTSEEQYLSGVMVPTGAANQSKIIKAWNIRDQHLARLQYGEYIDDLDLMELNFEGSPDFAINVREEGGLWVETHDGQYRAFVFINSADNSAEEIVLSIKRLKVN